MEWKITNKHNGMLIRDFLKMEQSFSRRIIKTILYDGGEILVNGEPQRIRHSLCTGDLLTVTLPMEKKGSHMKPENIPLQIVYEDDAILVIHKQAGMATIPSLHHQTGSVANGVLGYYEKNNIPYTVHVVTRLDRDTSGLLLIAKHRYSHSLLAASQKNGDIRRKYQAIVEGIPNTREGTIDANIGRKEGSIIERTVRADGQHAITHYKVIRQTKAHALMDIELETGRTHQIRVHFASIGHPLAGDDLYGGSMDAMNRQALHCYELGFTHPITKEMLKLNAPIPADMRNVISEE